MRKNYPHLVERLFHSAATASEFAAWSSKIYELVQKPFFKLVGLSPAVAAACSNWSPEKCSYFAIAAAAAIFTVSVAAEKKEKKPSQEQLLRSVFRELQAQNRASHRIVENSDLDFGDLDQATFVEVLDLSLKEHVSNVSKESTEKILSSIHLHFTWLADYLKARPDLRSAADELLNELKGPDGIRAVRTEQAEQREILEDIRERLPAVSALKPAWTIPAPTAYFTGQQKFLDQIVKVLAEREIGAITQPAGLQGLGGIGKTQLALAYAAQQRDRYHSGHFIVAESMGGLESGFAKIADPDLPDDASPEQIGPLFRQAIHQLQATTDCLIVLDNVDDIIESAALQAVLAELANVHVLLTCRLRSMGEVTQIEIDEMDAATGALYVLRRGLGNEAAGKWSWEDFREEDRAAALDLSKELEGFPLALDHAGAAIREERLSPALILKDYRANRKRILKNRGREGSSHKDSAWLTVIRSWEKLEAKNPAAAELVTCCAFLAADAILEDLFTNAWITVEEPLVSNIANLPRHRAEALRSGLVDADPEQGTWLTIHRVVQAVFQSNNDQSAARARFANLTMKAADSLGASGLDSLRLSNNLLGWTSAGARFGEEDTLTLSFLSGVTASYWATGDRDRALQTQESLVRAVSRAGDSLDRETLASIHKMATSVWDMGHHSEAIELMRSALAGREQVHGPDHALTQESRRSLAAMEASAGLPPRAS